MLTVDDDVPLLVALVQSISQSSRGRFVDHAHDIETSNCSGVLCRSSLSVVEISRDGNNGVGDLLTKVAFRNLFHFAQDHGGDFLWRKDSLFPINLNTNTSLTIFLFNGEWEMLNVTLDVLVRKLAAYQSLDVKDGSGRFCQQFSAEAVKRLLYLCGFEANWFLAASPTNRSSSFQATYEGVIRFPWSFVMISTLPPFIIPTHLLLGQSNCNVTVAEVR